MRGILIALALFLAACQPDAPKPKTLEPVGEARLELERVACKENGGRWVMGGFRAVCERTPKDANKSCSKESDCEGVCLARSRTCAPVVPLLGCNEVLTDYGMVATLCVD
ncbi:hypothetical protein RYZ20_15245 [Thioclava sp. A2]|uniref:hypothetical protein n=1 Tax=Thioclava sp. FCG-A2 TaxID=3080562 RepID=UPI0029540D12|nr:hypothetical protein [Thioclava sp. A2]MDV7272249.1 hypothetical protein [Thioclava sp. A2]